MHRVEPFLILAVAALHLTVVPRGIRANELMPDAKLGSGFFKQSWQVAFTIGESALRFYFYFSLKHGKKFSIMNLSIIKTQQNGRQPGYTR